MSTSKTDQKISENAQKNFKSAAEALETKAVHETSVTYIATETPETKTASETLVTETGREIPDKTNTLA